MRYLQISSNRPSIAPNLLDFHGRSFESLSYLNNKEYPENEQTVNFTAGDLKSNRQAESGTHGEGNAKKQVEIR